MVRLSFWAAVLTPFILLGGPSEASAQLRICNKASFTATIAVAYQAEDDTWMSEGWWPTRPGACTTVVGAALEKRYYYVYAESDDRGTIWSGQDEFCVTRPERFRIYSRECQRRTYSAARFFQIDTGSNRDWTHNLTGGRSTIARRINRDRWATEVADWMQNYQPLIEDGWDLTEPLHEGQLGEGATEDKRITLSGGTSYAVLALCDSDCDDVDLTLLDASGTEVDSDIDTDDFPMVMASPAATSSYTVRVRMYTCSVAPCRYAVGVFVK
jgi:uncharacterized membrane protein